MVRLHKRMACIKLQNRERTTKYFTKCKQNSQEIHTLELHYNVHSWCGKFSTLYPMYAISSNTIQMVAHHMRAYIAVHYNRGYNITESISSNTAIV